MPDYLRDHYSAIAGQYDVLYPVVPELAGLLRRALAGSDGGVIAELGAGTGRLLGQCREVVEGEGWRFVGIDLSAAMCRVAAEDGELVVAADFCSLPLALSSLDLVVFKESLHHGIGRQNLAAELARSLRPAGQVLVVIQSDWWLEPAFVLQDLVEWAREVRREPGGVVDTVLGDLFKVRHQETVLTETRVTGDYSLMAVEHSVLSYWIGLDERDRRHTLETTRKQIEELPSLALCRVFECFLCTRA